MWSPTWKPSRWYIAAVTGLGMALLAWTVPRLWDADVSTSFWMFAVLVILGELWPIKLGPAQDGAEVTTSMAFAFALLLSAGTAAAVVAQVCATAISDVGSRKPALRVAFNAAQYTVSYVAGGTVLEWLSPPGGVLADGTLHTGHLLAIACAGAVVFALNYLLTLTAIALYQRMPVLPALRRDLRFNASISGVMLTIAPVIVVISEQTLLLVPLLLVAVAALFRSAFASYRREQEALHDLLTGLPNRRFFQAEAERWLLEARRSCACLAVMLIDLDRFKEINDLLGHHIGDQVLQQIGPRLAAAAPAPGVGCIARLGGDEFAVLVVGEAAEDGALPLADDLVAALAKPFVVQGFPLEVAGSVGIARYPEHGVDVDALLQRADVAMYVAKQARSGSAVYTDARDHHSRGRLGLLRELRDAIARDQLVLYYQPLADIGTGKVSAVEALVRWEHPEHGLILPDDFVPLAEHTELIHPLTAWVLNAALSQCAAWRAAGLQLGVAVNLSVQNLYDPRFAASVAGLLHRHGLRPDVLELEVTENTVMADPVRAATVLAELHAMGVGLAIDDFGTGYSSFSHLRQLPVNQIKIDRSFVTGMLADEGDAVIVRSLVELGHNLGLRVVAEGVEDAATVTALEDLGCHLAQGFHVCRPGPAELLTPWLGLRAAPWVQPVPNADTAPRPAATRTAAHAGAGAVAGGRLRHSVPAPVSAARLALASPRAVD